MSSTLYDRVGGDGFFEALVDRFYEGVAHDDVLRPMYPDELDSSKRWLRLFLIQFWGGPEHYAAERGHPRLRGRHLPFPIDEAARDRWMTHMRAAVDASEASGLDREQLLSYFDRAATFMVNVEPPAT